MEPVVISIYKINAYPFKYKRYADKTETASIEDNTSENGNQMYLDT